MFSGLEHVTEHYRVFVSQPTPHFPHLLDQLDLCAPSARLLITESLAMHQLLKMPTTLFD